MSLAHDVGASSETSVVVGGQEMALAERRAERLLRMIPYLVLAVLVGIVGILRPLSLTPSELTLTLSEALALVFLTMGETVVLFTGGIDLSLGGILSVTSAAMARYTGTTNGLWIGLAVLIGCSWLPGLINGLLIVYTRMQPFIVTLAMWFILGGIAFYILPQAGGVVDPALGVLASGQILGVSIAVVVLVVLCLLGYGFKRTRIGLEILAVGSDRQGAFQSGIATRRALVSAYVISGVASVLAGVFLSAGSLSGDPTVGNSYILPAVAGAVIGGTTLSGGSGSLVASIAGALALTYVTSVALVIGLPSEVGLIAEGVLLVLSIVLQVRFRVRSHAMGGVA